MRKIVNILLLFLLFFLRLQFLPKLNLKDGQIVRVTGKINEEPQISGSVQKFKVGEIEIVTERYPEFEYGDQITAEGKLNIKNKILNIKYTYNPRQWRDLARELEISNIFSKEGYELSFPKINPAPTLRRDSASGPARPRLATGPRPGRLKIWDVKGLAIKLRQNLRQVYKKVFVLPYDGIVAGVVLGDKTLIPAYFYENLKKTGTLHILVASGMNISMMSLGILEFFCLFFKRKKAVLLLIALIWFYSLMTGLQPPIIRAAVMASVVFLGEFFGRKVEGERALWLAGLLMVFINPYLISDTGFQLSFMAIAGLVYIQPKLKNAVLSLRGGAKATTRQSRDCFGVKPLAMTILQSDNFTSSLSVQIATLPVLFIVFGQFNLLSPIINLFVLWTIPLILQVGGAIGIVGLFGTIGLFLVKIASYPFIPLLFYLEQIINWSAKITIFQIQIPTISAWWGVGYYLLVWSWVKKSSGLKKNIGSESEKLEVSREVRVRSGSKKV